jgi:shikimate dehydrogenase
MQNAALRAAGLAARYEALDVPPDRLAVAVAALAAEGVAGNVTIPHKAAVAAACARLTPLAQRTGAVNTFWTEGGALIGDNTDVDGFDDAIRELLGTLPSGLTVGVLGAGGAAAGVLAAIERWGGCAVVLYNRSVERARALAARFPSLVGLAADAVQAVGGADLVVNATSVGLVDDTMPISVAQLPPAVPVLDLVYRAGETSFVRAARQHGHRALGGLPMLVGQGAAAFERWFGFAPDRSVMWEAVHGAA